MPLNFGLRRGTNSVATTLNSHRFFLYSFLSAITVSAVVLNALRSYSNFYSVAISLSKSNRSVLALINFGFLITLLCGHVVQRIFFGPLRASEVERLYDRLWFFITESLLAFTIFRDEFDIPFALMFGFLLFVKSFHWLSGDRIEWMDQRPYPGPPLLFHIRLSSLLIILWATDLLMFLIAVESTLANGVGGMVLFASEYGILLASVLNTFSKYLLSVYEFRRAAARGGENAPPWEHKSMWIFYIELTTDFLKLTTYLVFFMVIIAFYGLPLNIVRDVYITARSFITRLRALHRYQTATRNMDQRYPSATADELAAMSDRTCIICREEMSIPDATSSGNTPPAPDGPNTTPKKLPCGHFFHFHCLRSWLERQQSCPTCRRTVLDNAPDVGSVRGAPGAPGQPAEPVGPGARNHEQLPRPGNNPAANPLGFMGRFFGAAPPQPVVPGPIQGILRDVNNPRNVGNGNVQEVVIQYHIQYQPQVQQQQPEQRQLVQPPPFPGFPGPRGAWQPWPTGNLRDNQADGATSLGTVDSTTSSQPSASTSSHASASFSQEPTRTIPIDSIDNQSTIPREAAAAAALRRQNDNSGAPSSSRCTGTATLNGAEGFSPISDPMSPTPQISLHDPTIPSLIPLYDYSSLRPLQPNQLSTTNGTNRSYPLLSNSHVNPPAPPEARPPLPPTLTEEQLVVMDRLTREAIDERLRVLEGVSGAAYQCIEDLMRLRSVLPSVVPTANINSATVRESHLMPQNDTRPGNGTASTALNGSSPSPNQADHGKAPVLPDLPESRQSLSDVSGGDANNS